MANMSYCRFRNTLQDFEDCFDFLRGGGEELSYEELRAAINLIRRAGDLVEMFEGMDDEELKSELSKIDDRNLVFISVNDSVRNSLWASVSDPVSGR
jgi:hypothetical protein